MKIVLAEKVSPATLAVLKEEPGWNVITADEIAKKGPGGLEAELADADALVVRSAVQVTAKLLESAPKLRLIGRAGVGVDNIDAAAATHKGIVVMNTPGANAVAVAELTLGLMVAMARSIPRANTTMHAGKWEKKSLQGQELRNKTFGIVGLGRIGMEVARRARSFGMELIGYDPFIAPAVARENHVTLVPLDEIFKRSDYLTLHVGLTSQTEGMINATSLKIMKPGVRIINCARGELIVDEALAEALKSGHVGGAALDVFTKEPLKDSAYFGLDNVLLSPHIAGSTDEAQEAIGIQLAQQVRDYLKLGVVQNAVNVPSLSREEYTEVAPYIEMAERLGHFLSHATNGNLESIQLTYAGRIQEEKKESTAGGAGSTLKITLHSAGAGSAAGAGADASATATVLHGSSPRLLTYDGIDIEAPLNGTLVTIRNHDVPGVVGRIGTILGEHGINIANFALGRAADRKAAAGSQKVPQGQALAVVQIDARNAAETNAAIEELRMVEAIASVRLVDLESQAAAETEK